MANEMLFARVLVVNREAFECASGLARGCAKEIAMAWYWSNNNEEVIESVQARWFLET